MRILRIDRTKLPLLGATIVAAFLLIWFAHQVAVIGVQVREDFWAYWAPYRVDDIQNALVHSDALLRRAEQIPSPGSATVATPGPRLLDRPLNLHNLLDRWTHLRPVYGQILQAWVGDYDHPYPDRVEAMDYPPLRLLAVTLWTWHVQGEFPGLTRFPFRPQIFHDPTTGKTCLATDEIARPLLTSNTVCTALGALEIFLLVWIWVQRGAKFDGGGWGDPMLLLPVAALGLCAILSRYLNWSIYLPAPATGPIDERFTSISWWLFVMLKFVSVVALARVLPSPFRGPVCGVVAGTFFWLNPAIIIDSHGWPQWDPWIFPAFFGAAILVSLNGWFAAGVLIGIGCMFKGQILFAAPVLVLAPLIAGWPMRFLRIVVGMAMGAGICVWPWLVTSHFASSYILATVFAAVMVVLLSFFREPIAAYLREFLPWAMRRIRRKSSDEAAPEVLCWVVSAAVGIAMLCVALLVLRASGQVGWGARGVLILLAGAILALPWIMPRRLIAFWLAVVFTVSLWLTAFSLGGKFSWWNVGFEFGTIKHTQMEIGNASLSNLAAILHERYDWGVHDAVGLLQTPLNTGAIEPDMRQFLGAVFFLCVFLCGVGAAIHLRRGDPHFLIALIAPWVIFPAILTQMSARYPMFPAAMTAIMVAVSVRMSLWHLVLTVIGCITFFVRVMRGPVEIAPLTHGIVNRMHPDLGWLTIGIAAIFLVSALAPSRRGPAHTRPLRLLEGRGKMFLDLSKKIRAHPFWRRLCGQPS